MKIPEIGALIIITTRIRNMWASDLGGKCPNEPTPISLPLTGIVEKVSSDVVNVNGYGFSIEHIEWEYVNNYQIF